MRLPTPTHANYAALTTDIAKGQAIEYELKSRIVAREIDHQGQALRDNDVEEEAISFE